MVIRNKPKRLAIYFFFDDEGIVDQYVTYFLDDLKKNISELLIVSNGAPTEEGKKILEGYGKLLVRENTGFDVWAYKEALQSVGWEELQTYDEVILLNNTIMGPIFPFRETFEKMDKKDVDFWGLTMFFQQNCDPTGCSRYGYIPDHIQSHFIACRRSLIKSTEFQEYWEKMPPIKSYWESVGRHEIIFTKYFQDLGFKSAVSVEMEDLRVYSGYPLMMCPVKMAKERKCPVFKRRSFFNDPQDFMMETAGEQSRLFLEYLRQETSYDVDLVWETVLRKYHQADIVKSLNLNYILSDSYCDDGAYEKACTKNKTALILYLQYRQAFEEFADYANTMPPESDLYILTDSEEKKKEIEQIFLKSGGRCPEIRVTKGGDVQALLIDAREFIMRYDIVCFAQDMKGFQSAVVSGCQRRYMESLLAGKNFVKNVISLFDQNPKLGMLAPLSPNHGIYFTNIGKEWRTAYPLVCELANNLGIHVPMSEDKPPVSPLETIFWFRPPAFRRLYEKNWNYDEFSSGSDEDGQSLQDAIERLYSFAVQEEGYYPGILMSDRTAEVELLNLHYYLRTYNTILMEHGIENFYPYMCGELRGLFAERELPKVSVAGKEQLEEKLKAEQKHIEVLYAQLWKFQEERQKIENLTFKSMLGFWYNNRKKRKKK